MVSDATKTLKLPSVSSTDTSCRAESGLQRLIERNIESRDILFWALQIPSLDCSTGQDIQCGAIQYVPSFFIPPTERSIRSCSAECSVVVEVDGVHAVHIARISVTLVHEVLRRRLRSVCLGICNICKKCVMSQFALTVCRSHEVSCCAHNRALK